MNKSILDCMPVAVIVMDPEFKIIGINAQAEQITGFSGGEAEGQCCSEIFGDSLCADSSVYADAKHYKQAPKSVERKIVNRYGEHIPVKISASVIHNEKGDVAACVETIEDISVQKEKEREKASFYAMMAHDMKAPMIALEGLTERLAKKKDSLNSDKLDEYLKAITDAEKQLQSLVTRFLEYTRRETGHLKLNPGQTDLKEILGNVCRSLIARAEKAGIRIRYDLEDVSPIWADGEQLQRCFMNLLDNAIKFSPADSEICIQSDENDREVRIRFIDQGRGIPPQEIPHIFDTFHRQEDNKESSGYGLGLSVVRDIVRQHGGRVSVASKEGEGTVFTVRLPKNSPL